MLSMDGEEMISWSQDCAPGGEVCTEDSGYVVKNKGKLRPEWNER